MKRFIWLLGLVLGPAGSIGALSGCSIPGVRDDGIDHERVASIERAAGQTGVRVYWINPPRKVAAAGG